MALVLLSSTVGWSADYWKGKHAYVQKGLDAYEKEDYETALREWRPFAEQGHAAAQFMLGVMYSHGQGVPQNLVYAHMWYNIAASKGHKEAAELRDLTAKEMTPSQFEKAQDLAVEYVKKKFKGCD